MLPGAPSYLSVRLEARRTARSETSEEVDAGEVEGNVGAVAVSEVANGVDETSANVEPTS